MDNNRFELTEEIISTADRGMDKLMENNIKLNLDEISSYKFPLDEPFGLQVTYEDAIYCFVIRFSSKNKNLICTGPGAHERDKFINGELLKPPFFDRWSWYKFFEESFIAYADPMLFYDDEIKIAWFVGTKDQWYLKNLSRIIEELCKNQKINNNNILFYGSSGGGYTSVVLGTLLRNSKVLINNSQLFILNYWEVLVDQLFDMLYDSFKGMDKDEIIDEILYRLDVIELFKKENYAPFITYYVNVESEPDILKHGLPLIEQIYKLKQFNGLNVIFYKEVKQTPHEPMVPDKTITAIKEFCRNYLYNSTDETCATENQNIYIEGKYSDTLKKQVKDLRNKNKKLKKEYNEIVNSSSWKLTSPLRKIKRKLNKLLK